MSGRRKTVISLVVGLLIVALLFWFIGRNAGEYERALEQVAAMAPAWIALLAAASLLNIAFYPLTAMAAIHQLSYRHAFVSRQAGFTLSNIVPGGGAVAVATQYAVLAKYGVPQQRAAAAVSADAIWTYLFTLGAPSLAVALLVVEGRSTAGYTTTAAIGLGVVIVSLVAIIAILRSEDGARRVARIAQRPVTWACRRVRRTPPDLTATLVGFHATASALVAARWKSLTVTNIGAQMAPMLVLWAALAGLGSFPGTLTVIEIFAAYSIALLLTAFPITPGGLGTVDAALIALLVAFGVDGSTAVAADLIWRVAWFLPQLLVGGVALGMYSWDRRRDARAQRIEA